MLLTKEQLISNIGLSQDIEPAKLDRAIREAETIDLIGVIGADNYARLVNDNDFNEKYMNSASDYTYQGFTLGLCYLSYYRYLSQGNTVSTAVGEKLQQFFGSQNADYRSAQSQISYYKQLGDKIVNQTFADIEQNCKCEQSKKIWRLNK